MNQKFSNGARLVPILFKWGSLKWKVVPFTVDVFGVNIFTVQLLLCAASFKNVLECHSAVVYVHY